MNLAKILESAVTKGRNILSQHSDESILKNKRIGWSQKEILGHLIDSAINNRRRFVIYQIQGSLIFDGYDQEQWVAVSKYSNWSWNDLIEGWHLRNKELVKIIDAIPKEIM